MRPCGLPQQTATSDYALVSTLFTAPTRADTAQTKAVAHYCLACSEVHCGSAGQGHHEVILAVVLRQVCSDL